MVVVKAKKGNIPLGASRPKRVFTPFVRSARSLRSRAMLPRHNRELCYTNFMAYIRKFETSSGATGVQVLYKEQGKVVKTIHIGSASSEKGITRLLRKAQSIIDADKSPLFDLDEFDKK